ncbi:MAG: small ribosomal subunit Rsm22 family protein [Planctomycetota bacterium]
MLPSLQGLDLPRIQRLRSVFLAGPAAGRAVADYWRDVRDLEAYDAVLAERIGWKWRAALEECRERGFAPPANARVLDYGCGTGIALRRYLEVYDAGEVVCHDRSLHATRFAVDRLRAAHPELDVQAADGRLDGPFDVVLASHLLSELDRRGLERFEQIVRSARLVLLVESGNRQASRRLSALRDSLLASGNDGFEVVAPCPHGGPCPALAVESEWCHFFATPPGEVFTDGDWVRAARELQIDLRSLPYSFLAVRRRSDGDGESTPCDAAGASTRWLGRARVTPRSAELRGCSSEGLVAADVSKRSQRELWRSIKKHPERLRGLPRLD